MESREDAQKMEVNAGYAAFQLSKALANGNVTKAEKWLKSMVGMADGSIGVGTRTPVKGTPHWVTLEVLTGGFATGNYSVGGELTDNELDLAAKLQLDINKNTRKNLNAWFLTDNGLAFLQNLIAERKFRVNFPEEGALLVIAWLYQHGYSEKADDVLNEIFPFIDRLRFFPEISAEAIKSSELVCLENVSSVIENLKRQKPQKHLQAQSITVKIWRPFYARMINLLLETCTDKESFHSVLDQTGKQWQVKAKALVKDYYSLKREHGISNRFTNQNNQFYKVFRILEEHSRNKGYFADATFAEIALNRYIDKYGYPDSEKHAHKYELQLQQCRVAIYSNVAKVLISRLERFPLKEGISGIKELLYPVSEEEAVAGKVDADTDIPTCLKRKTMRCQLDTIESLIAKKYITSGDVLAVVLPQISSQVNSAKYDDEDLKAIYGQIYMAFSRRRSLLLLNFEKQVKMHELPWIQTLESFEQKSAKKEEQAREVLLKVARLNFTHFPHQIIPNKLVQEFVSLGFNAGLDLVFTEELAADIFMGDFSPKFLEAAREAASILEGSVYERYYEINYTKISKTRNIKILIEECKRLSGQKVGTWNVAANGMLIEQQQIITTQNLATLFTKLNLVEELKDDLEYMIINCFEWICQRLQLKLNIYHARLINLKNCAYAWRQLIFYLSVLDEYKQKALLGSLWTILYQQNDKFYSKFRTYLDGLKTVVNHGNTKHEKFLGWTTKTHPLM